MSTKQEARELLEKAARALFLVGAKTNASQEERDRVFDMFLDTSAFAYEAGIPDEDQTALVTGVGETFGRLVAAVNKAREV